MAEDGELREAADFESAALLRTPAADIAARAHGLPEAMSDGRRPNEPLTAYPQLAVPHYGEPWALVPSPHRPRPLPRLAPRLRRTLPLAFLLAGGAMLATAVVLFVLVVLYRFVDPPFSTLMLGQRLAGTTIRQRWVPLERISNYLSHAVILSEDGRFCRHRGVDWGGLAEAIESSHDGIARGGSTITMQVVKNLFLWPSRSYLRKALEIPLAYGVELFWSKRRILEIYLNVAEWGPGIFGAEAAALYHFRKPASLLTLSEAALLAVSLPNPLERQAGRPGPLMLRLASHLATRMHSGRAVGCLRAPRDRPQ